MGKRIQGLKVTEIDKAADKIFEILNSPSGCEGFDGGPTGWCGIYWIDMRSGRYWPKLDEVSEETAIGGILKLLRKELIEVREYQGKLRIRLTRKGCMVKFPGILL